MAQFLWNAWAVHLFFLGALALALWECGTDLLERRSLAFPRLPAALAAFLACAAASSVRFPFPEASRTFLCGLFTAAVLFLSARRLGPAGIRAALQAACASALAFSVLFLLAHVSSPSVDTAAGTQFYLNHNVAATWIALGLSAALALGGTWKWPAAATAVAGLAAFSFTGSRAGFGGLLLGFGFFLGSGSRWRTLDRRQLLRASLYAAAVAVLCVAGWRGWRDPSVSDRWRWWSAAARMAARHPLLGAGPGSYERQSLPLAGRGLRSLYAHNFYLQTAGESGIPAALAFAAFAASGLICGTNPALSAGILAVSFQNFFDYSLHLPGILAIFWMFLAWDLPAPPSEGRRWPFAASVALAAFLALSGAWAAWSFGFKPLSAIRRSLDAQDALDRGDVALAERDLRRAAEGDPLHSKYASDLASLLAMEYRSHPENRGLLDEALRRQAEALRREPDDPDYRLRMDELSRMEEGHAP